LDLDAEADSPVLDYARAQIVVASRAAGIAAPLDSPSIAITDLHSVEQSARTGRGFGFSGKLCIHPAQLKPVRTAFTPTEEQITWARSVVSAGDAAVQVAGQMIDKPVTERARRILHRAGKVSA
jgi:citrate lyase subunit beta/citryl-CoA lyase